MLGKGKPAKFWHGVNGFIDKLGGIVKDADKLTTLDVNTSNEFSLSNEMMLQIAAIGAAVWFFFIKK